MKLGEMRTSWYPKVHPFSHGVTTTNKYANLVVAEFYTLTAYQATFWKYWAAYQLRLSMGALADLPGSGSTGI
jgi:hypothetical protein